MAIPGRTAHSCVMDRPARQTRSGAVPSGAAASPAEALLDAARILARAEADEAAAHEARELYRAHPMAALRPDAQIGPLLDPGERVFAVRPHALVERRAGLPRADATTTGLGGSLYLTSRRLVIVGRTTLWFDLDGIEEVLLSGDRLLLVMRDGQGAELGVSEPRLLRVEIAAARLSARG